MKTTKSNYTISFQSALQTDVARPGDHLVSRTGVHLASRLWLGLREYSSALEIQKKYWNSVYEKSSGDCVLGLEHPAVITLGSRGQSAQDLLGSAIPHLVTDRGGQATLHSEGQLVIYPLIDLRRRGLGVREFVELLQATTQELLSGFGIESSPADGAGLKTATGKIAFIGLRVERGITRHGMSLNVSNDLGLFAQIRSCGVSAAKLDRMIDHPSFAGTAPDLEAIFGAWMRIFERNLPLETH